MSANNNDEGCAIGCLVLIPILLCLTLLIFDYRVLVWETKVVTAEGYTSRIECTYFTGRNFVEQGAWGRDNCKFLVSGE